MSDDELLTAREAATYLKCPSLRAFYAWRRRHGIASAVEGRPMKFLRGELLCPQRRRVADFRELARRLVRRA